MANSVVSQDPDILVNQLLAGVQRTAPVPAIPPGTFAMRPGGERGGAGLSQVQGLIKQMANDKDLLINKDLMAQGLPTGPLAQDPLPEGVPQRAIPGVPDLSPSVPTQPRFMAPDIIEPDNKTILGKMTTRTIAEIRARRAMGEPLTLEEYELIGITPGVNDPIKPTE